MSGVQQIGAMDDSTTITVTQLGALAQETRFDVFRLLAPKAEAGMAAGDIARTLDVAPNTLSAHLSVLQRSKLIDQRREGRSIIYFINRDAVQQLVDTLVEHCCLDEANDGWQESDAAQRAG